MCCPVAPSCERDLGPSAQSGDDDEDDFTLTHGGLERIARRLSRGLGTRGAPHATIDQVVEEPRSVQHRCRSVLGVGGQYPAQGFWTPSIGWFHTVALAVKVDIARRRHGR